ACTIPALAMSALHAWDRRTRAFGAAFVLALAAAHVAFATHDGAPPVWDEGLHLLLGTRGHDFLAAPSRQAWQEMVEAWSFYPPLHHALLAVSFRTFGLTPLAARLLNLVFLAIFGWGTYRAGAALFGRAAGVLAAALVTT